MNLVKTANLSKFKKAIGNSNHFLITILIGLNAVTNNEATKSQEFNTLWNPKDLKSTTSRSREFSIKASLAWVIDNLEMYFNLCNKKPKIFQDEVFIKNYDKCGRSIYEKFILASSLLIDSDVQIAFVDLSICWRNKLVHSDADNNIISNNREVLILNKELIRNKYSGLDIIRTLKSFDANKPPTFKEAASLVRSLIDFVYLVDHELILKLDKEKYINDLLHHYFKDNSITKFFNSDKEKMLSKIKNIFKQYGLIVDQNKDQIGYIEEILEKIYINEKELSKK